MVGYGTVIRTLTKAAKLLEKEGISCEIIDLQTIYPYDAETIVKSVRKTGRCLIAHEAPLSVSISSELSAKVQEECFLSLKSPITRVCGYDTPFPLAQEPIYLPTEWKIYEAAKKCIKYWSSFTYNFLFILIVIMIVFLNKYCYRNEIKQNHLSPSRTNPSSDIINRWRIAGRDKKAWT